MDIDNALARMKSGLDGLADAIGIDDKHWALSLQWGDPVKGGEVSINVRVYRRATC